MAKYRELENYLRSQAENIGAEDKHIWTSAEVSELLTDIAGRLAAIRISRSGGIDATTGMRSNGDLDI